MDRGVTALVQISISVSSLQQLFHPYPVMSPS